MWLASLIPLKAAVIYDTFGSTARPEPSTLAPSREYSPLNWQHVRQSGRKTGGSVQIHLQVPDIPVDIDVSAQVVANCSTATGIRRAEWMTEARLTAPEFLLWVHGMNRRMPVVDLDAITGALIAGLAFRPAKPGDIPAIDCIPLGPANPPVRAAPADARKSLLRLDKSPFKPILGVRN